MSEPKLRLLSSAFILLLAGGSLCAQSEPGAVAEPSDVPVDMPTPKTNNRVGVSWKVLNNVGVSFSKLGAASLNAIPPAAGGVNHVYDNGFNNLDVTGNAGSLTWNWGYQNAGQYNPAGGGSISMNIANAATRGTTSQTEDFNQGVELSYMFQFADMDISGSADGMKAETNFGLRAAFSYNRIDSSESSVTPYTTTILTDTYALGGVIPPPAPYTGTFAGPGPLLSDTPARATTLGTGTITGSSSLKADVFQIKAGPYVELELAERVSLGLTGGVTVAPIDSKYAYSQTAVVPGILSQTTTGDNSRLAAVFGAYAEVSAAVRVVDSVEIFASAGYNYLKDFDVETNGNTATLQFGTAWTFDAGVAYSF